MKITITLDLDPEYADPDHATGVTEEGFMKLNDLLGEVGTNIEIALARNLT